MKKNQRGFSVTELLLLLILVSIIGFGGYYVWNTIRGNTTKTASTTTQQDSKSDTSTGGPAPGHIVATTIKLVTGQYIPANVDVKKGSTVTWEISDLPGETPKKYAIASDTSSSESFSSDDLKTNDTFSHTFNTVGNFGWHDKYNGNLVGSVTVTE